MRLVGITGNKRSGKSTVAGLLERLCAIPASMGSEVDETAVYVKRDSFAGPIHKMINVLLHDDQNNYGIDSEKEENVEWLGVSRRRLLQTLGTEWGRHTVGTDIWIKAAEHRMHQLRTSADTSNCYYVFDDVRFPNEAHFIQKWNGVIIKVEGGWDRTGYEDNHESESHICRMPSNFQIRNEGTLEELAVKVSTIFLKICVEPLRVV